ncbi:MAG TPA: protocatechuate 3,4-dioxygenase [Nitrospiraceae bacterium]|nr:protocatechuate 3,4-dioxygenase [Nitrospiraceae bacterium]
MIFRHSFLIGLVSLTGIWCASTIIGQAADTVCPITPDQTEGPYYPPKAQIDAMLDQDNDLTRVGGRSGKATGQIIYVVGRVRDQHCRPIEGAMVEIWQASENGRYSHPRDRDNRAPLDPNFQYWGKNVTDKDGRYLFKTIKPGSYQAGRNWTRPPHIHFKVSHGTFRPFVTQMYFAGDAFQAADHILNEVPSNERERVIVSLEQPGADYESDARVGRFDLTLSQ